MRCRPPVIRSLQRLAHQYPSLPMTSWRPLTSRGLKRRSSGRSYISPFTGTSPRSRRRFFRACGDKGWDTYPTLREAFDTAASAYGPLPCKYASAHDSYDEAISAENKQKRPGRPFRTVGSMAAKLNIPGLLVATAAIALSETTTCAGFATLVIRAAKFTVCPKMSPSRGTTWPVTNPTRTGRRPAFSADSTNVRQALSPDVGSGKSIITPSPRTLTNLPPT